jgi:hypothetical protein
MKIRPVGSELFYADGQRDRQTNVTKTIIAFRDFANARLKFHILKIPVKSLTMDRSLEMV